VVIYLVSPYHYRCLLCSDWSQEFQVCNPCLVNWKGNEPPILVFGDNGIYWKTITVVQRQWRDGWP
jgi:hypothetical protein